MVKSKFFSEKKPTIYPNLNGNFIKLEDLVKDNFYLEFEKKFKNLNSYNDFIIILQYYDPELVNNLCYRKFEKLAFQKTNNEIIYKNIDNYIYDNKKSTDKKFKMIFKLLLKNCVEKEFIKNFPKFLSIKSELYLNLNKDYMVDFLSEDGIQKVKIAKDINLETLIKVKKLQNECETKNDFEELIDLAQTLFKKKERFNVNKRIIEKLQKKNLSEEHIKKILNFIDSLSENIIEDKQEKEKTYRSPQFIFRHSINTRQEWINWFDIREFEIPENEPDESIYNDFQIRKDRAVNNVIKFLRKKEEYDFSQFISDSSQNGYFLRDIFKNGKEVIVFVRCTDFGWFQIVRENQSNVLKKVNCECWGDNGRDDPEIINIGKIIRKNGLFNKKILI